MKLIISALLFTQFLYSAELPSRWRFEYHIGKVTTEYVEEQSSILFQDTDITQRSAYQEFIFQYFLLPPYIDFTSGAQVTGYQVDEPEDPAEQFTYLTGYANLGFLVPWGDYFQLKIIFEHFYTTMLVRDDAFGFQNLRGNQIYPELEFLPFGSDMFLQISPYLKFPLWTDTGNRRETTVGLKLKIPLGSAREQRFPTFAYQKAIIIKLFYTNMALKFKRNDFIESDMKVNQYGASIGFSF